MSRSMSHCLLSLRLTVRYNCEAKRGWGCYLDLPCVARSVAPAAEPTSSEDTSASGAALYISKDYRALPQKRCGMSEAVDDLTFQRAVSQRLYRLNAGTRAAVDALNARFRPELRPGEYVGVHLRLGDKRSEVLPATWSFLSNSSRVAALVARAVTGAEGGAITGAEDGRGRHVFLATDDCAAAARLERALRRLLPALGSVRQSCEAEGEHRGARGVRGAHSYGHRASTARRVQHVVAALADVEMLRDSGVFVGYWGSSFAQMVLSLRHPRTDNYVPLDYRVGLHTD